MERPMQVICVDADRSLNVVPGYTYSANTATTTVVYRS